jgi:Cu(I)/Ag(I) efflux system membrane fusion protein
MKKIFSNKYSRYILFLIGGLLIGWFLFHSPGKTKLQEDPKKQEKITIWTCSMHPQIRMAKPGKCPLCGMDLIPLNSETAHMDSNAVVLSDDAAKLANIETFIVTRQNPKKEIRLYGKVQADERLLQSQVAQIPGRIEKLMVNFTGEKVDKGQILATVYSPELITAQQELFETSKTKLDQPEIYEATKEKLRQWKLTESQIEKIESSSKIQRNFEVLSGTSGIVTSRRVNNGDYISPGKVLYEITDLSRVWILFDVYESDLPFLHVGDEISFSLQALPGKNYSGKLIFIDPVIDPLTRVAKVRVETENQLGKLKPEMFATGSISSNLGEYGDKIVVPRSAVLWTGKRSIVYVKGISDNQQIYKMREVELGPMLGQSYVIMDGLSDGEEIITNGIFSVDASAELEGKPSMMNQ